MNPVQIKTPSGVGTIDNIYISDLGYLMLRINNLDGSYTTYNLGQHNVDSNIFTDKISHLIK